MMSVEHAREQTIKVGVPGVIQAPSPHANYGVVFEDDGATGYFYALDFAKDQNPIVDALHIYNAGEIVDRDRQSQVRLVWSRDGLKALLTIDGYPHAVFDFAACRGYCRTGFPPAITSWSADGHGWDDNVLGLFQ